MMLAKFNAKVNGINEGLNIFVVNRAKVVRGTGLVLLVRNCGCQEIYSFL